MSDVREALLKKLQTVHQLIEMCIQLYMNKEETIDYLSQNAKIEPEIIKIVWERLEKENPRFFKAYHLRLALKDQIKRFNELLEKQVELMRKTGRLGSSSSNGSQIHSIHNKNGLGEGFVSPFTNGDPMLGQETSSFGQLPRNSSFFGSPFPDTKMDFTDTMFENNDDFAFE